MIDLTQLFSGIITVIVAIITCFILPLLKKKFGQNKLNQIKDWVATAVKAAEQIYVGSGRGQEKKQFVVDFLKSKGFTIDDKSLDNIIESTVYQLIL